MENSIKLHCGDNLEVLKTYPDNHFDSVVTDSPYGISFMGKKWDYGVPKKEFWSECFRVLKPGGHLLNFSSTRTYHRMAVEVEDAGFEIRDQIMWIYGSGFPKSHDISKAIDKQAGAEREVIGTKRKSDIRGSTVNGEWKNLHKPDKGLIDVQYTAPATDLAKQWQGWGTALKPANEPIVVARKPLEKGLTIAENVVKWGTGALNIDESRIASENNEHFRSTVKKAKHSAKVTYEGQAFKNEFEPTNSTLGRWPANVLFDEEVAAVLDEQSGNRPGCKSPSNAKPQSKFRPGQGNYQPQGPIYGDSGGASRFFYVAKSSKRERNTGCSGVLTWENADQSLQGLTVELNQLLKDISDDTARKLKDIEWNTLLSGSQLTDQYLGAIKFTTSTVLNLITELKTSNYSQVSSTSANILGVIRAIETNGLNPAESAEFINQLSQNTTEEETAYLLGVVAAVLQTLHKIRGFAKQGNVHSTVKPIKLMQYLIKLVTPPCGTVLDPFMGSGSTGVAAVQLGHKFVGVELSEEYLEIAKARILNNSPVETTQEDDE